MCLSCQPPLPGCDIWILGPLSRQVKSEREKGKEKERKRETDREGRRKTERKRERDTHRERQERETKKQ